MDERKTTTHLDYILVRPHTLTRWKYYIDRDLEQARYGDLDHIYQFLCEFLKPPATILAFELLQRKAAFLVIPKTNTISRLKPSAADTIDAILRSQVNRNFGEAIQSILEGKIQPVFDGSPDMCKAFLEKSSSMYQLHNMEDNVISVSEHSS